MNFAKPGWIAWGNCSKCGRRFDTRRHTRAPCTDCNRVIFPRITRRVILELGLWCFLFLFDNVEVEAISQRVREIRTNLDYNSLLSEYSYYYPYC